MKISRKTSSKPYVLVSAMLGWLGAIDTSLVGIWLTTTCLALTALMESLLIQAYIAGIASAVSVTMLLCGSYILLKGRTCLGGATNFLAGILAAAIYSYFTLVRNFLGWMGLTGYFLLAPALISGAIGLSLRRK